MIPDSLQGRKEKTPGAGPRFPWNARRFLGWTLALTGGCWGLLAGLTRSGMLPPGSLAGLLLWFAGGSAPTVVACVLAERGGRPAARSFWRRVFRFRVPAGWYLVALGVPVLAAAAGRGILLRLGGVPPEAALPGALAAVLLLLPGGILLGGLEEVGWRGFLQVRLSGRRSLHRVNLWIGTAWAFWHLPLFFLPGTGHYGAGFGFYWLSCLGYGAWLTWLFHRTRSVPLAVLFHAAVNAAGGAGIGIPLTEGPAYALQALLLLGTGTVLLWRAGKEV